MDAFYASVEQHDDPDLRGRPVIVGGDLRRGVVSACSYQARAFGVHSAQPMAVALRRCPQAVVRPVRMGRYREVSRAVMAIFAAFTDRVEALSIDEAFLDVTGCERLFGTAREIAVQIRSRVRARARSGGEHRHCAEQVPCQTGLAEGQAGRSAANPSRGGGGLFATVAGRRSLGRRRGHRRSAACAGDRDGERSAELSRSTPGGPFGAGRQPAAGPGAGR